MPKLRNPKHERFCQEYVIDLNITRAATDASFSKKTARTIGSKLLTRIDVEKRIAELMEERAKRTQTTQDQVIEELKILAHSDFRDFGTVINELGVDRLKLKTFDKIEGNATRAIKSISEKITKTGVQLNFKLHGKTPALELLARHLGMLIERHELTGEDGGPIRIEYILIKKKRKRGGDRKGDGKENSEANPGAVATQGSQGAEAEK